MDGMTWYNGLAKPSRTPEGNFAMTDQREASAQSTRRAVRAVGAEESNRRPPL